MLPLFQIVCCYHIQAQLIFVCIFLSCNFAEFVNSLTVFLGFLYIISYHLQAETFLILLWFWCLLFIFLSWLFWPGLPVLWWIGHHCLVANLQGKAFKPPHCVWCYVNCHKWPFYVEIHFFFPFWGMFFLYSVCRDFVVFKFFFIY